MRNTLWLLLAISLLMFVLVGCTEPLNEGGELTTAGDQKANQLCARHGGIKNAFAFQNGDGAMVVCTNGIRFNLVTGKAFL